MDKNFNRKDTKNAKIYFFIFHALGILAVQKT